MRILAVLLLGALTGCTYHSRAVRIEGEPVGARVRLDGVDIGKTPTTFTDKGSTGKTYRVEVAAPGYETRTVALKQEARGTCLAAALPGLILFPFLINALWCWSLPEEKYQVNLDAAPATAAPAETASAVAQ